MSAESDYKVGKTYTVPCAGYVRPCGSTYWVPVIGPKHSDPQLGVKEQHYHVDGRFTNRYVDSDGKTTTVLHVDNSKVHRFIGIENRCKKCLRLSTGMPVPKGILRIEGAQYSKWYKSMIGKSCKGRKCPHYGQKMIMVGDRLECPLHGLVGDPEKQVIIERI